MRPLARDINTWVLVLAAGDGTRLRALTTSPSGVTPNGVVSTLNTDKWFGTEGPERP
jgi:hypothetical protein